MSDKPIKIVYYGLDGRLKANFLKETKSFVREGESLTFDYIESTHDYLNLCDLILKNEYDLYLVDFTLGRELKKILTTLYFEIKLKKIKLIGLWTSLDTADLPRFKTLTGIQTHFTYATNDPSSVSDLLISVTKYLNIDNENSKFYERKFLEKKVIKQPFRLRYLSTSQMSLETDAILSKGQTTSLEIMSMGNFPYRDFRILDMTQSRINFSYSFRYTLDYFFLDKRDRAIHSGDLSFNKQEYIKERIAEISNPETVDEDHIKGFINDFEEIEREKLRRSAIVKKNIEKYNEKSFDDQLRVLIVDRSLQKTLATTKKPIWEYPYRFYIVTSLNDRGATIDTASANIIAIDLPPFASLSEFKESFSFKELSLIIDTLNEVTHTETLIVIFNAPGSTEEIYPLLKYENVKAIQKDYSFDLLLLEIRNSASERDKKVGHQYYKLDPNTLYPSIFSDASAGYLSQEIELNYISECEMSFNSKLDFPMLSSIFFRATESLSLHATIFRKTKNHSSYQYTALIHSLSEDGKKRLRLFLREGQK